MRSMSSRSFRRLLDGSRDVQAVWKPFHFIARHQQRFRLRQLFDGDYQVEVKADQRFHVGVDSLSADYAIPDSVILEERDQRFQEVGVVECHGFPKGRCSHGYLYNRNRRHNKSERC
jgi:hypothetical protein